MLSLIKFRKLMLEKITFRYESSEVSRITNLRFMFHLVDIKCVCVALHAKCNIQAT